MRERGGPTTQSGILYQNSVTALYLGRLCDDTRRPDYDRVVHVRVEAPEEVDDTVVFYADEHVAYVQAKENITVGDKAWRALWAHFANQYRAGTFVKNRDRLRLHLGEIQDEHYALRELCNRARTSDSPGEWLGRRLTQPQRHLVQNIGPLLGAELAGSEESLHGLFSHVEVEIWPFEYLERDLVPHWIPETNLLRQILFRLLRDRVGGEARYRGSFEARTLRESLAAEGGIEFRAPPDLDELRLAIHDCGALLRQHKNTFGNTKFHLPRHLVDEIVEWALDPPDERRVGMLLDQAGRGKTVVLRDVLDALERRDVTVLAIKADQQLSGIKDPTELQQRLALPESVERTVSRVAALSPTVVIIDQLDALSLSLARDQSALDIVLGTVARLRTVPGAVVLLSCRTFDRNTDPRIKRFEVGREFALNLLEDGEVNEFLAGIRIEPQILAPGTRELLRVPLHLDLFASLAEEPQRDTARLYGIASLQELYGLLWEDIVLRPALNEASISARERILRIITERMDREQRTSVPRSTVDTYADAGLTTAAEWLASTGMLIGSTTEWTFLHQTFFDYCYARFFVEDGRSLSDTILASDQGLFARPQVVQVLSYLRGTARGLHLRELQALLAAPELRAHLRDLLLRWFGALQHPTQDEWLVARRMLSHSATRPHVLAAMASNVGWFTHLRGGFLQTLLNGEAQIVDNEALPFVASCLGSAPGEVAQLLQPYLGRDELWDRRIRWILQRVTFWEHDALIGLHEQALRTWPLEELRQAFELDDLAKTTPAAGCRAIRLILDRILDSFLAADSEEQPLHWFRFTNELEVLNGSSVSEALDVVSEAAPVTFLEEVLPWLERVVELSGDAERVSAHFSGDALSTWHQLGDVVAHHLIETLTKAITKLARNQPDLFEMLARRLSALPYGTPQRLLAAAYRETPDVRAGEALRFLIADPRRLQLGDDQQYDSRKLIEAIYPFLTAQERSDLEACILAHTGHIKERKHWGIYAVKERGRDQLYLLQSIPPEALSSAARQRLQELERKFPGERASDRPSRAEVGWVGPPIDSDAAANMSDAAWINAMTKYQGAIRHKEFLRGGARELSSVLTDRVKAEPERFYHLALRVPEDIDDSYVSAFIQGLADAEASAEWLFDVVRRFVQQPARDIRNSVARALEKRIGQGLPNDMLRLLDSWVRDDLGRHEIWYQQNNAGDLFDAYINTERGTSLQTLMHALSAEGTIQATAAMWNIMEFISRDPSAILRAGAAWELTKLLEDDRDRAISLFERLLDGYSEILDAKISQEFPYYAGFHRFERLARFVRAMMQRPGEKAQQRGAELACIAYISPAALESDTAREMAGALAAEALTGPAPWRRGAARIYARNLIDGPTALCAEGLVKLFDDPDREVRRRAGGFVGRLREEHIFLFRELLEQFAASRAAITNLHAFEQYLWEHGPLDPAWALSVVGMVLVQEQSDDADEHHWGGEELVRLVMRIYTDPTADPLLRKHAMDLFDRLMERYAGRVQTALGEWDRQ
jgi:HEAT repeat protein